MPSTDSEISSTRSEPPPEDPQESYPGGRGRVLPRSVVAALVVGTLIICCAIALNITTGALSNLNPFKNGVVRSNTIDRSGPAVLKSITDMGQFQAASGYYEIVVDVEKDVRPVPSFLAGKRQLLVAAGTVDAGVDLRALGDGSVKVDQTRTTATITLPPPSLSKPNLNLDRTYVYSEQRGLIDRIRDAVGDNTQDQQQLYILASKRLTEAALQNNELSTRAETNTKNMLERLLRSLGFTNVTVNFAAEGWSSRITSAEADRLMINTPAGIEGMFRETGRDRSTPRPAGFQVKPDPAISEKYGNVIVGPPRRLEVSGRIAHLR